jgi:hypothetical protein
MQKVDLNKVLEALLEENHDEATGLVHEWIVQLSGQVHESLMAEDEAADDIAADKDAIEAEEFYGEAEDEAGAEAGAEEAPAADADAAPEMGAEEVPAETVEVNVADIEAVMANLHAEFAAIMNGESPAVAADAEPAADADLDLDAGMEGGDEVAADADMEIEKPAVEAINVAEADEAEEVEESEEEVEEAVVEADEFDDLEESFNLDESALPDSAPNTDDAEAVEIKAEEHHGYEREAAPGTKKPVTPKGEVGNARKTPSAVKKGGDSSAMLNKKTGFGGDSPKSPLSGLKKGK